MQPCRVVVRLSEDHVVKDRLCVARSESTIVYSRRMENKDPGVQ